MKPSLLFFAIILNLLASPAFAKQAWQNMAYIQDAFNEIALKNEYKLSTMKVLKWRVPIHYNIQFYKMKQFDLAKKITKIHLNHLQEITEHPFYASSSKRKTNFSIIFTQDKNYQRAIQNFSTTKVKNIERESNCMGQFKTNRQSEIISAVVIIPIDHAMSNGLLAACVVEELTQVMGLPNDSDWVNPSIANDRSKIEFLTGLDYLFLKILYNKKLKTNTPKQDAQQTIKHILEKLKSNKTIQRAHYLVNKKGLYRYAN